MAPHPCYRDGVCAHVCAHVCVHVCVCVHDLQESQHVSQSEPAHLCGLPYPWMKVIQHRLGEARCPVFSAGLSGNLCPTVGVCECVYAYAPQSVFLCLCFHLLVYQPSPWRVFQGDSDGLKPQEHLNSSLLRSEGFRNEVMALALPRCQPTPRWGCREGRKQWAEARLPLEQALRIEVSGDLPITDCSPPLPAPVLPQALVGPLFLEWDSGVLELGEG